MKKTYTVYYTRTVRGNIDVDTDSPGRAQQMVENGNCDFGNAREYDEPIDCYDVVEKE